MSKTSGSIEYPPDQYPFRIKGWDKFQHYKFRNPPWIKLHTSILGSEDWVMLDDASRLLAIVLMLIASQHDGFLPKVVLNEEYLKRVGNFRRKPKLKPLIVSGFLIETLEIASDCKQMHKNAIQSTETETEKKDIPPDGGGYVFESGVIRINSKDMERWRKTFSELDVSAELEGMSEWAALQGKNWFHAVKGLLAKRNREVKARRGSAAAMAGEFRV